MQFDGFDWDDGNWPKCARHGVSKDEIEHVFRHGFILFDDPATLNRERRYRAIGMGINERRLFIVFCLRSLDGNSLIRPISARYMHAKEVEFYERLQNKT